MSLEMFGELKNRQKTGAASLKKDDNICRMQYFRELQLYLNGKTRQPGPGCRSIYICSAYLRERVTSFRMLVGLLSNCKELV